MAVSSGSGTVSSIGFTATFMAGRVAGIVAGLLRGLQSEPLVAVPLIVKNTLSAFPLQPPVRVMRNVPLSAPSVAFGSGAVRVTDGSVTVMVKPTRALFVKTILPVVWT